MQPAATTAGPIPPSAELLALQTGEWGALPISDPLLTHIIECYWPLLDSPMAWQGARFSKALYLFQETAARWALIVRFYPPNSSSSAGKVVLQVLGQMEQVHSVGQVEKE